MDYGIKRSIKPLSLVGRKLHSKLLLNVGEEIPEIEFCIEIHGNIIGLYPVHAQLLGVDASEPKWDVSGINGVWLHAVLRDLAPGGTAIPEFGVDHERRLANLAALVKRAKKYGIGVYLYMNEPRAMPAAFFKDHVEMGGVREGQFTALCTSHPAVRRWMGDALTHVFRQVPDLAGIYAITASENLTNCASHYLSNVTPLEPRQQPRPCRLSLEPRLFSWCRRVLPARTLASGGQPARAFLVHEGLIERAGFVQSAMR